MQIHSLKNISDLSTKSPDFVALLRNLKPGKNQIVQLQDADETLQLAVSGTELKIGNRFFTIASVKNIQYVLEEQETEAWQKLIRVLTHEIMNSITPIASLSSTLNLSLEGMTKETKEGEFSLQVNDANEIREALQTINRRSLGLIGFVEKYRNLTRIPIPSFKLFRLDYFFKHIQHLFEKECNEKNIFFRTYVMPDDLELSADEELLEQVMINIIKNAIHALEGISSAKIDIKALYNARDRITIQVTDNGHGILKEVLDKIFIPFFTTKQKGSGIGLSLSRQIMKLHGGSISAKSIPEEGTIISLVF